MTKSFVGYALVNLFVEKVDIRVDKKDGTSVVISAHSLNIMSDPITGKTKEGFDVSIYEADIENVVRV